MTKERDVVVEEVARARDEFCEWKALKEELANEIERKYNFNSLIEQV